MQFVTIAEAFFIFLSYDDDVNKVSKKRGRFGYMGQHNKNIQPLLFFFLFFVLFCISNGPSVYRCIICNATHR